MPAIAPFEIPFEVDGDAVEVVVVLAAAEEVLLVLVLALVLALLLVAVKLATDVYANPVFGIWK